MPCPKISRVEDSPSSPEDCSEALTLSWLLLSPDDAGEDSEEDSENSEEDSEDSEEGPEAQEAVASTMAAVRKTAKVFLIEIAFMRIPFLFVWISYPLV